MALITLRVLDGADRGRVYDDVPTPVTIGREEGNTIQLNDERVSRFHLKIQEDRDKVVLTDLESTNGTKVNGEDIQLRILRFGDMISLGRSVLLFGKREQIAERLAGLRRDANGSGTIGKEDSPLSGKSASAEFDLNLDKTSDIQNTLYAVEPPDLPQRLSPAQAAQLSEMVEYLHIRSARTAGLGENQRPHRACYAGIRAVAKRARPTIAIGRLFARKSANRGKNKICKSLFRRFTSVEPVYWPAFGCFPAKSAAGKIESAPHGAPSSCMDRSTGSPEEIMSTPPFVHLHCHSHYSLLDGASPIDKLVERAKTLGMNGLALTDHGNLHGALEFYQTCKKEGINPILGYEAYIAPDSRLKRDAGSLKEASYHLTLLAQNRTGFRNLIQVGLEGVPGRFLLQAAHRSRASGAISRGNYLPKRLRFERIQPGDSEGGRGRSKGPRRSQGKSPRGFISSLAIDISSKSKTTASKSSGGRWKGPSTWLARWAFRWCAPATPTM